MSKQVTMADLAAELHVSVVTVSKALRGQKGVSEATRERVLALAQERGYSVKKSESEPEIHRVGVLVPERYMDRDQSFYWELYRELSRAARGRRGALYLEAVGREAELTDVLPEMCTQGQIEGIVLMGSFLRTYRQMLERELTVPFVLLDAVSDRPEVDMVVTDNVRGGYVMTDYLLERGHSRIGFFGSRCQTDSIDERYLGYYQALFHRGLELDPSLVIDDRDAHGRVFDPQEVALPEDLPTAFFANCDSSAQVLIRALKLAGRQVPDDISVVGFDNCLGSAPTVQMVTTYGIDMSRMAGRAIHILFHKMAHASYSSGKLTLPGTLIERQSVRTIGDPVPRVSSYLREASRKAPGVAPN